MEIFHSKEVTDSLLQDYVGIWKYEDTFNRLVFQVELITMDNSRTIALRGRYSLNKDGEYITNEFNDPYIIRSKESSISGLLFKSMVNGICNGISYQIRLKYIILKQ